MVASEHPVVWSYTFLDVYDRCKLQAKERFITKTLKFKPSPESEYGNLVHGRMDDFFRGKRNSLGDELSKFQPIADQAKAAKGLRFSEYDIGIRIDWGKTSFFGRDVWGRCKLDYAVIDGPNALILDWKTGKKREDPLELEIQALALKVAHPEIKNIWGCYMWLKTMEKGQMFELGSGVEKTRDYVEKTMKRVAMEPWVPTKNHLCAWCSNSNCVFYKETRREDVQI